MSENKNERKQAAEKQLAEIAKITDEELFQRLETCDEGLNQVEASDRLEEYGKNIIDTGNENSLLKRVRAAIINPFNIVLLIVAAVTLVTDVIIAAKPSWATFLMLIFVVAVSGIISFVQEEKSNSAAQKLQNMITNKIDVIRNGSSMEINIEEVVPGDVVKLASGDMLPGDVRFIETKDLFIDQSQLTGESQPVEKFAGPDPEGSDISELDNLGFMGSNIISGSAKAVILTTGNRTYLGSMAKSLNTYQDKSSFERNINSISKLLIRFMIVMVPIIFIANFITKGSWLDSLMFGITIAVGLMPEMLPVIMTSSLAKGAVNMSRKQTIVKRLGAIQTFGEMDVLCTDKTGTLTQDEIVLEKYMDVLGREDKRVLRHAFMNSFFQTGLKNLMDVAIINRAEKEELSYLKEAYVREDEIPFDFSRRRMSVVLRDKNGKRQLITKGAVEEILSICGYIEIEGEVKPITQDLIDNAQKIATENNLEGIRVIAVAQKNNIHDVETFGVDDESDMVLIGFVGFLDPPKPSAESAIAALHKNGVRTVVLTGDTEGVAINICGRLGIPTDYTLTGAQVEEMTDDELNEACEKCHIYSKLSPYQKQRVVKAFQTKGHTVGYMGDGINDSLPLKQADVGISVDTAVDIAKEVADIILLEKDLNVLDEGVIEGRRTFANMSKYLKMSVSGNFGNMFSVLIASIFLPFLPLLPIHILVQNILNDFAQLGMPFDHVEDESIRLPKKWNIPGIKKFMVIFGLLSTVLDVLCFLVLWFIYKFNCNDMAGFFQNGWFMFGIISQTVVIHTIRTPKVPFIKDRASLQLNLSTLAVVIVTLLIGFTAIAKLFDLPIMIPSYVIWLAVLMLVYTILAQILKHIYIKKNHEWV
ncbi:magnesium-translocating P-type ATPase [Ruminococcus sp.]|uniref:magnesium-translocating P-type ATPase n=1 Tax=Ruminococcus sp. TaxID=41978 RepID=UPI001B7890F0|nr:magnesium-translocating P-type ATPase [Ruminococcus sp.]MBP5431690.1 magnesium-translocating P-type ATPase [Ruminococcus sp.]